LEVQNCWLKFFNNKSGIGSNIHWLMDVFSLNISMVNPFFPLLQCQNSLRKNKYWSFWLVNQLQHGWPCGK
jgi:hypothetical protein